MRNHTDDDDDYDENGVLKDGRSVHVPMPFLDSQQRASALDPGFHEPGTGIALGINKLVWESFNASDRRVIEDATAAEYARSLAEFNANNALGLRMLRDESTVKILKFDDAILKELYRVSKDVVAEAGSGEDLSRKIYASHQQFLALIKDWSEIAEGAVLSSRRFA